MSGSHVPEPQFEGPGCQGPVFHGLRVPRSGSQQGPGSQVRVSEVLILNYAAKKVFKLLEKVFSSLTVYRKPSFHNFHFILMF